MSALVHSDYAMPAEVKGRSWLQSWPMKRLVIAAVGCALMALSGTGLANYLDTSAVTAADAAPADGGSIN